MKTKIVITDLTRMYGGRVCIAGYDGQRQASRPVVPGGIPEAALCGPDGLPVIYPFALVSLVFLLPNPQPPHTEDWTFDLTSVQFARTVQSRQEVLAWSLFAHVAAIFEQPIAADFGYYVMDCAGPRSLGTIQPKAIEKVAYEAGELGNWDYRLLFSDAAGASYRLKITDFTWQTYRAHLRGQGATPAEVAQTMTALLTTRQVYLRVGLARGWKKFPDRCYLQLNAVYTFPDYLEGKTFADFRQDGR
jgi:hypothetical protein